MRFIDKNRIFLLEVIVKRNFASRYKDSVLGIIWTILRPLLIMLLFTIIFSTIFKKSIENFQVYFLSGWCIFMFVTSAISTSLGSLKGNKNILLKTPAPKHIFILGSVISEFLDFLITIGLLICVMVVTNAPFHWSVLPFSIFAVLSSLIMIIGIGLMLSIACVYYTDIQHLWGVLVLMLMYASCIFYPIDIIPEPFRYYLSLNPLYWAVEQFRSGVFYGVPPQTLSIVNFFLLSLIVLIVGIIIFKKFEKKISIKF